MSKEDIRQMQEVTYFNNELGSWGFYGCLEDKYEKQKEAYDSYLAV